MEVWWTGTDGSIQGSWMYDKIEWHRYQLEGAGPGSAVIGGGLRAQSRRSDVLHLWWVSTKGSLEGAFIVEGKTPWTRYQMAGHDSASLSTGICSLHRYSGTEEIFWIAPNGAMFNAYWYEGMPSWNVFQTLPGGSAKPNGKLMGVSREPGTMEIWYAASDGGVSDRYWYDFRTKRFGAPILSGGLAALGGWTSITLKEQGSIRWNGDGHDSGADDYDYGVVGILRPRPESNLAPITLVHSGHVSGHIIGSSGRDDPWDQTNDKDYIGLIQKHYDDYANGTFAISVVYTSGFQSTFESLINTVVKWSVGSLLDGVGILIFIGVEVGSLVMTGSLVPGARILNGVLWMAGPGNTLLAIAAGGIASAGSRSKVISEEDYRWANNEVFNGTLPPRDKIRITDTKGKDGRAFTFPMSDGSITLNVGGMPGMFENPQSNQPTLIHELVHAWQIHHTPFQLSLLADALASQLRGSTSYDYPDAGLPFKDMNLEQQAQIVEDWWTDPNDKIHPRRGRMKGEKKDETSTYFRYIRDNIRTGNY
ncbi:uncharacterized protein K444DRAFT_623035 [Hyaloscypha bicolor E]|uniref:Uncharacterized protein n=1 Tax=Hyaloscypha bicolor E TaxID=1095630 RepID=A0A2J6SFF8_9HELO|nr:uncharacterized protein K444DRAFT_623035 [Hyaloscypha bicolor E]PMD49489.1 hypothetical protein K444DRAFT_623035 [Hyaloscypha bicolor E]